MLQKLELTAGKGGRPPCPASALGVESGRPPRRQWTLLQSLGREPSSAPCARGGEHQRLKTTRRSLKSPCPSILGSQTVVGTVPGNPAALVSKGSGLGASGRGSGGEVILILRALAGALRQRVKSAKEKRRSCLPPGLDELMREGLRLAWCGHDSGEEGVQMETLTCTIPRTESTCWGRGVAGEGLK